MVSPIAASLDFSAFTRMGGDEEIVDALKQCGVEKFIDRDFSTLSGGEKRMVSIAGGKCYTLCHRGIQRCSGKGSLHNISKE